MQVIKASPAGRARRLGFTLIEMLAVIVILTILFAFLITTVLGAGDSVDVQNTRQFLAQVEALLSDYEIDNGDYPPSTFGSDIDIGNKVNMGAEQLILSLYAPDRESFDLPDERLGNSDGDSTKQSASSFTSPQLFELVDSWDNPIAYFHRRDYGSIQTYLTAETETGELFEVQLQAKKDPKTQDYFNRRRFQLISAGSDGIFGSDDDIGNFGATGL